MVIYMMLLLCVYGCTVYCKCHILLLIKTKLICITLKYKSTLFVYTPSLSGH